MRIYEVTFDGRTKEDPEWSSNWKKVNVAIEDDSALAAIELAARKLTTGKHHEYRPAEVRVLAED